MGILQGLSARGWSTRLWHPPDRRGGRHPVRRLFDFLVLQGQIVTQGGRPDVLYIRDHFAAIPSVLWARLRHVPVVWEANGPGTDVLSSWPWARWLLPLLEASTFVQVRLVDAVIAVTPELSRWARDHGAKRCYVVSNGADTELFSPAASTATALPDKFVSFTGTLATWQGVVCMLDATEEPTWPSGVSLVVVGDGVLADLVRQRSDADPRVVYLGRLAHRDVAGIVARGLGAISPMGARERARTGVVPLKFLEAMACGVPVIVTDLPGQADIVSRHGCGIVIPPDDPVALAAAVKALDSDQELARLMGRRARRAAVEGLSWDASAARTHDILINL